MPQPKKEGATLKIVKSVKVKNALGLHIRPAAAIVKLLQGSKSEVFFTYKNETINAKSIMSILTLAAKKNSKIIISVSGEDASSTMNQLVDAFERCFGD